MRARAARPVFRASQRSREKIRQLEPAAMVTLVKSIRDNVRRAAAQAGWNGPILELPYPGR